MEQVDEIIEPLSDWEKDFINMVEKNSHSYGRMMQLISALWQKKDPKGALTIGDCAATVKLYGTYGQVLDKLEEQEQEIEKLKIENVTLQPIYSRRQLEEKITKLEKERDFLKDTRDILINYDGCKTEKQLMGLVDETRLRISVLLDGKIEEYQKAFG